MSNSYLSTKNVSIDYQVGGPGRGQRRILDVVEDLAYGMGEWTESLGAITRDYEKDPRTNRMRPMPVRRGNPEAITFPLTCRMKAVNILERFGPDDRLVISKRYTGTLDPANLLNYRRIEVFTDCAIVDRGHSAGATDGKEEEAWVDLTTNVNAGAVAILLPVAGKSIPHGITAAADVSLLCGCIDPEGVIWLGTAAESGPAAPHILKGVRDADGKFTWTAYDVTGQTADIVSITAAGDSLIFAIGTNLCRAEKSDPATVTTTAFGAAVSKVVAIDAANIIAVGASGTVKQSEDGGLSWTTLVSGVTTALNSIAVRSLVDWWIGGATGTLLHYYKGTFTTLADPTSGAGISTIALPEGREDEVYLGTSTGAIWKTQDGGVTWTQVRFPGDSAGSVDHLAFADWMGPVLYIVHSPVSGPARLLRDLAGGLGGNTNVEVVPGIPANSGLNGLLVEGVNDVFLPGDVHSGSNLIIKVEA